MRSLSSICLPTAVCVLLSAVPASAQNLFGKNLVVNGDAEAGPGTSGDPVSSIPGWTTTNSPKVITYSSGYGIHADDPGPASRGNNHFYGSESVAKVTLTQKIDLSAAAAAIDAGNVSFDASGYLGGEGGGDTSAMSVTFSGSGGNTLSSVTMGPLSAEGITDDGLFMRRKIGPVPAGARSATVEVDLIRNDGSYDDGAADNISLILNNAANPNTSFGSNLVVNGNAETLQVKPDNNKVLDVPNWCRTPGFVAWNYSDTGGDLTPTSPGPSDRGNWYFYGGTAEKTNAYQDIDLSGIATQIDTGKVTFNFSGWLGGFDTQNDNTVVTAQFTDWAGHVLGSTTLGPVTPDDRQGTTELLGRTQTGGVPAGSRMAHIMVTITRTDGSDNDGLLDNLSLVLSAPAAGATPSIQQGGVVSAASYGGFQSIAPGTWIEIYGNNLATDTRQWAGTDFQNGVAPNALDGTKVTIAGQPAFISYISGGQVNAQVPSNIATGTQQLIVTTPNGTSAPYSIVVNAVQPGLLAPPAFKINGKQYVVALHTDGSYVLPPGAITGLNSRQAKPGETILLYGIGFGSVNPAIPAGQVVAATNQIAQPLIMQFGQTSANLAYQGLAPNYVGLYQFNVVVPNVSDNDAMPFSFNLGGINGSQSLYIAVKQ